jgi:hypothetical protein
MTRNALLSQEEVSGEASKPYKEISGSRDTKEKEKAIKAGMAMKAPFFSTMDSPHKRSV